MCYVFGVNMYVGYIFTAIKEYDSNQEKAMQMFGML